MKGKRKEERNNERREGRGNKEKKIKNPMYSRTRTCHSILYTGSQMPTPPKGIIACTYLLYK